MPSRRSVEGEYRVEGSVLAELGRHYFPTHSGKKGIGTRGG